MSKLPTEHIEKIIEYLKTGQEIPEQYKDFLFPTTHKEYQLAYSGKERKEDVLADNEESKAVPFQVEKVFNGERKKFSDDWQNLLIFGDNLQILKSFYRNEDDLIKDKVKGKVKLIYIDPPFATKRDFDGSNGAKAYTDKIAGAEFVEFLRKRVLVAKEILAEDGLLYVHLDHKKAHYVKIVLDEIFGEENFRNEIIWHYTGNSVPKKCFPKKHDTILLYSKSEVANFNFEDVLEPYSELTLKRYNHTDEQGRKYKISALANGKQEIVYAKEGKYPDDVWDIPVPRSKQEVTGYPTQKPEVLLEKIIKSSTKKGDIVMDFFSGSGTTPAVAEKLGRRWIACDIGKLSVYTIQKRLLEIENSKDLENSKQKYGKKCKSFSVVASGLYDLGKVFGLTKEKYIEFVKQLFEIEKVSTGSVGGVPIDGQKRGFYVKIFPYWELPDVSVDEEYLQELHKNIGRKVDGRFYIISPAQNNSFIGDYHEIDGVRYYFLRVPYQVIKELHKVQFKKLRQPQKKEGINDLDESIGFHFVRPPEVKAEIKREEKKQILEITDFKISGEASEEIKGFQGLAMVLLDFDSNGKEFVMDEYHFTSDLVKAGENDDLTEKIQKNNTLSIELPKSGLGEKMMVIYVDIYGNEFRQPFNLK